jgi:hypothetical protein
MDESTSIRERLIATAPRLIVFDVILIILLVLSSIIFGNILMAILALWLSFLGDELVIVYKWQRRKEDLQSDDLRRRLEARERTINGLRLLVLATMGYGFSGLLIFIADRVGLIALNYLEQLLVILLYLTAAYTAVQVRRYYVREVAPLIYANQ